MCTAWTGSIFAESKWRPLAWLLGMGLGPLQLHATAIAAAADLQARTAQRCLKGLAGGIDEPVHLAPTRHLEPQGDTDACSQRAGSTGLPRDVARHDRAPRPRGLQRRGRATAELGRPPLLGVGQRRAKTDQAAPAAHVSLAVLDNGRTATIKPILAAKVPAGAPCFPDAYRISPWH